MTANWLAEELGQSFPVRLAAGSALVARGRLRLAAGREYEALADICRAARVTPDGVLRKAARRSALDTARRLAASERSSLLDSYLRSAAAASVASLFTITGGGPHDLFRDLIVLKGVGEPEKGVVLLKYARTFDAVASVFDLPRLMERYLFVLEPCWAGYCDPSILLFLQKGNPVFIQCFTEEDYRFIADVGRPFVPVRLGPADWVDAATFGLGPGQEKVYDVVMVANWARHKRHRQLFKALSTVRHRDLRVLLVGFPWAGRTSADIRAEAASCSNPRVRIDIVEQVPQSELAGLLSRCRAFVFLSKKEGDNKALVEALFADVPAVVYEDSIGGATSRINGATGVLSSDDALAERLLHVLDNAGRFSPRAWALAHTGSGNATRILDETIRATMEGNGESYTGAIAEKKNGPNLAYVDPGDRERFERDYGFIAACLRRRT